MQMMTVHVATAALSIAEARVATLQKAGQEVFKEEQRIASELREAKQKKKAKRAGGSKGTINNHGSSY
jgi:hypothetical protein